MKRLFLFLLCFLITANISGCEPAKDEEQVAASQIANAVMNSMTLPEMVELRGNDLTAHYQVEMSSLADYSVYTSNAESSVADVAVFVVTSVSQVKQVTAAVSQRVKEKSEVYANTNSVQLEKLKNRILLTQGEYILYAVGDNSGNAEKIFKEMVK